jgi:hypothetical protein
MKPEDQAQAPDPEAYAYLALLEGNTVEETRGALEAKTSRAIAAKSIDAALRRFRGLANADRDLLIGWSLAASQDLARKMIAAGDLVGALRAVRQVHDIASGMEGAIETNGRAADEPEELEL